MTVTVVDHTDAEFVTRFNRRSRENGARTYSIDIVNHHIKGWKREARAAGVDSLLIGTCGPLDTAHAAQDWTGDLAIQYVHKYPQANPEGQAAGIARGLKDRVGRVVFVVSHFNLVASFARQGLEAHYIPMGIDSKAVKACATVESNRERTAIWLGNVTQARLATHREVARRLDAHGWKLDTISDSKLNASGDKLSQPQAWGIASDYSMGVGVARSGMELQALGLPLLVAGASFGGIATNDAEWQIQTHSNWGGLVVTHSRDIGTCIDDIEQAVTGRCNDIRDTAKAIVGSLA